MGLTLDRKTSFLFLLILLISFGDHSYDLAGFRGASADLITDVNGTFSCSNGTVWGCFSGYIPDDFEAGELLRHYAGGARWLRQTKSLSSVYTTQNRGAVCKTAIYANCINPGGGGRTCLPNQRCKRAPG